jgi:hypothetical protein
MPEINHFNTLSKPVQDKLIALAEITGNKVYNATTHEWYPVTPQVAQAPLDGIASEYLYDRPRGRREGALAGMRWIQSDELGWKGVRDRIPYTAIDFGEFRVCLPIRITDYAATQH